MGLHGVAVGLERSQIIANGRTGDIQPRRGQDGAGADRLPRGDVFLDEHPQNGGPAFIEHAVKVLGRER